MEKGWKQYIPLSLLTNQACKTAALRAFKEHLKLDNGSVSVAQAPLDARSEKHLTTTDFMEASGRFLNIISLHYPDVSGRALIHDQFEKHFHMIVRRVDFGQYPGLYVEYDIQIRRFHASGRRFRPADWQHEIFTNIRDEFLLGSASGRFTSAGYPVENAPPAFLSVQPRSSVNSRPSQRTSFRADPKPNDAYNLSTLLAAIRCFLCGVTTSPPRQEKLSVSTTIPKGAPSLTVVVSTSAPCAANPIMGPMLAQKLDFCPIVTPLCWLIWRDELEAAGCLDSFLDIPSSIRDGFHIGVNSLPSSTYIPRNHSSTSDHPEVILDYIATELLARRYSGPFHPSRLEQLIGPFRSSPLGTVPKANSPGVFRIIQDFSYPRHNPAMPSVNSDIDSDDFQCEWGTFAACVLLILRAPPGTQASVNDVEKAYRCVPIAPQHQPLVVIMWKGLIYMDHCAAFGTSSAPGIFGRIADAAVRIFRHHGVQDVIKWVDDFVFFRYPSGTAVDGSHLYSYDESLFFSVAERLGWPWSMSKHMPFADCFEYNGFRWSISMRTVEIPLRKKGEVLVSPSALDCWLQSHPQRL
ncbi:polyprotein [Sparassis crispa]|uniref:Polyprotein n=1 Tax=Sparassis crispa TaxID=139825 RepID=A0A401H4E9_9APHY|nr:polyprotein [Sparassis crispa]GBE89308.1 polyprotein [Sparassis crispa]